LFRDAGIDEAWAQCILQWLQSLEAEVSSQENEFRQTSLLY
jgi:hypothetical protein